MSEVDAVFEDLLEDEAVDPRRELLEDEDTAYLYLVESWLTELTAKLRDARHEAGLTQVDLAERLGTKQPAIARLERDHEGRFSLRRFAEYALACGVLPLDMTLKPANELRKYALINPEAPRTEKALEAWSSKALAFGNVPTPKGVDFFRGLAPRANVDLGSYLFGNYEDDFLGNTAMSFERPARRSYEDLVAMLATTQGEPEAAVSETSKGSVKVSPVLPNLRPAA